MIQNLSIQLADALQLKIELRRCFFQFFEKKYNMNNNLNNIIIYSMNNIEYKFK